jgi:hypothetical protein
MAECPQDLFCLQGKTEILKDPIRVTRYLGKQELAFCGNDESTSSCNLGNYVELLDTIAEKCERLARHLRLPLCFQEYQTEYSMISLKQSGM